MVLFDIHKYEQMDQVVVHGWGTVFNDNDIELPMSQNIFEHLEMFHGEGSFLSDDERRGE